ncbi:MAG: penicillin-binding protein 1A [Rhodospirillales bacterium]
MTMRVLGVFSAVFAALAVVLVIIVAGALVAFQGLQKDLPDHRQLARYAPPVTTRVYSGDGRLMAEYAAEKRIFLPIDVIPKHVIDAFVSAEDKTFWQHPGIDVTGVVRAILTNVENYGTDRRPVGASTITQQVAKNFLIGNEVSMERKIKEAILAFRIEQTFSKDHILELYLNEIYLGNSAYGVAAAALAYFNKNLDELTVAEAAVLAGLPKAPSFYDPMRQPQAAKARRDWVLGRMLDDGRITADEASAAIATPLGLHPRGVIGLAEADYFGEEVRREVVKRYGDTALYKGGLTVHATVDVRLQAIADETLRNALERLDRPQGWRGPVTTLTGFGASKKPDDWAAQLTAIGTPSGYEPLSLAVILQKTASGGVTIGFADGSTGTIPAAQLRWAKPARGYTGGAPGPGDVVGVGPLDKTTWALRQPPKVEGALVALDPHTGRVLAMSGGYSYGLSQFNRATQAMRQPGSTFKPMVYLAAFEQGYTPSSIINDAPFTASMGAGEKAWVPHNYSDRFYGPTTLRVGLEQSRNIVAVRLADEIGMDKVVDVVRRFNVADDMPPYLAYALGAGETTLLRLTAAYGMFVNGGRQIVPTVIDRIQDRYGRVVYRQDPRLCVGCLGEGLKTEYQPEIIDDRPHVTDDASAYQVVSLLQGVVARGTAEKALAGIDRPIAGKTGTSNEAKDVWFIGFTPDLVVGVYLGYDDPKSLGNHAAGGTLAAPIFRTFIEKALQGTPPTPFRVPSDIRLVRVDATSGKPSSSRNPNAILEAFKPGSTPDTLAAGSKPDSQKAQSRVTAGPISGSGGLY